MKDAQKVEFISPDGLEVPLAFEYKRDDRTRTSGGPAATKEQLTELVHQDLLKVMALLDSRDVDTVVTVVARRAIGAGQIIAFVKGGQTADAVYALATAIRNLDAVERDTVLELAATSTVRYQAFGEAIADMHRKRLASRQG